MAEKTEKEKQRDLDFYELGGVDNVIDLAPETNVGPSRRAREEQRILQPNASGFFEGEAGGTGGLGAPLSIGAALKHEAPVLQRYEEGYNAYAQPLRSTLRSMGRLKDVSLTGAPLTPEELMKRPELAARFGHLATQPATVQQDQTFDTWSASQNKMKIDMARFGAGQHQLAGVIANYRRVQLRLKQHGVERERASKVAEKHEIDKAAETLAKIVDVSAQALTGMGEVGELLEAHGALNAVEDLGSVAALPQASKLEAVGSSADLVGEAQSTKSVAQHVGSAASKTGHALQLIKKGAAKAHNFGLSVKDVFTALIGGPDYLKLEANIDELEKQISQLGLDQEAQDIRAANEGLKGFVLEIAVRRDDIRGDRIASRRAARTFAHAHGGGDTGVTAMYAAEAYQELAAFGQLAQDQRQQMVDPDWRRASAYLHGQDVHHYAAIGALNDAQHLDSNLCAVAEQRAWFAKELPRWQSVAAQWSRFIGCEDAPLIPGSNEADARSAAP